MNKIASSSHERNLEYLADMNGRTVCPRCSGIGFFHNNKIRHDKVHVYDRCKRCCNCDLCDGSGFIKDLIGCHVCKGFGFIHPQKSGLAKHKISQRTRCKYCINCLECDGVGALDPQHSRNNLFAASKSIPTLPTDSPDSFLPTLFHKSNISSKFPKNISDFHPDMVGLLRHLENSIGREELISRLQNQNQNQINSQPKEHLNIPTSNADTQVSDNADINSVIVQKSENDKESFMRLVKPKGNVSGKPQKAACPKCKGLGWRHEGSARHYLLKTFKCKYCVNCSGCNATGLATDKIACTICNLKGFIHTNNVHIHNVSDKLRCFYCQECEGCQGIGLMSYRTPPTTP